MDNQNENDESFAIPSWIMGRLRRLWAELMPAPRFGPPSPEISREEEGEWQWWHIPVSVKRRWFRRDISCCRAYVLFLEGDYEGQEFPLRWRSDLPRGSSETTLVFGKKRMLPLVARRDNSPKALLTDNEWLMLGVGGYSIVGITGGHPVLAVSHRLSHETHNLNPGEHKIKIRIMSGHLTWESQSVYGIRVPPEGASNSHFTVTMRD